MTGKELSSARTTRGWPWSAQVIGIAIGTQRTVAVERAEGGVRWVLEGPGMPSAGDAADTMRALLERLPLGGRRWRRPVVAVAVSADFAQQKRIFGLPPLRDRNTANALVRESAPRFFRSTSEDLVTSEVEFDTEGEPAAAAFPGEMIRVIRAACSARGIRLVAIVPADTLPTNERMPVDPHSLETAIAWHASALTRGSGRVRFNALTDGTDGHQASPARIRVAAVALGVSLVLALVAPLASARLVERSARRAHDEIRVREVGTLATTYELARVSDALVAVTLRAAERHSALQLLSDLSGSLPPGAVLTHLQVDSAGGTLIALAPSADGVLKGISESRLIARPEIVGPVTREVSGTREVERVTLHFTHRADSLAGEKR